MNLTKVSFSMINGAPINVLDYGADKTGVIDSTTAIQSAIDAAEISASSVYLPAGTYKITDSLVISQKINLYGDGNQASVINLYTASTATFAINVDIGDNTAIVGLELAGFGITCDGGSAKGCGLNVVTTATNSAISQSTIRDIYIKNCTIGVQIDGVVYMNAFKNITVSGANGVSNYGWHIPNTISGQVIYNTFENLEVTNVGNNGYSFYSTAAAARFKNLTADACCYFGGTYTSIDGIAIEGISATTPASTSALQCNQIQSLKNVALINIPNSKCNVGINAVATSMEISNVRFPDSGAGNQPNSPIVWQSGGTGTLSNVRMDRTCVSKLETSMPLTYLAGFIITDCATVTDYDLSYRANVWTPSFGVDWTTTPTVNSAQYTKVGRQVTVTLSCNDGVCIDGAIIAGLPFTSSSSSVSVATGFNSSDRTQFGGVIAANTTTMSSIPALTLTGKYWDVTATYFV